MGNVPVVALIKAKPGKEKELEAALTYMVEETHKEAGCVLYALHKAQTDPGLFVFVESWASEKDLQAHAQAPHMAKALQKKEELVERMEVLPLDPLKKGLTSKNSF